MKRTASEQTLATARAQARVLRNKAKQAEAAAVAAKTRAREAKSRLKRAKEEASTARKAAKSAKRACAKARKASEDADRLLAGMDVRMEPARTESPPATPKKVRRTKPRPGDKPASLKPKPKTRIPKARPAAPGLPRGGPTVPPTEVAPAVSPEPEITDVTIERPGEIVPVPSDTAPGDIAPVPAEVFAGGPPPPDDEPNLPPRNEIR